MTEDLGSDVGDFVAFGTNSGEGNDVTLLCNGGASEDAILLWTAPEAGTFIFDTSASNFDTVLGLFDPFCDGSQLECNDDAAGLGTQSQVERDLAEGESVLVVIEGFAGSTGDYLLDINQE